MLTGFSGCYRIDQLFLGPDLGRPAVSLIVVDSLDKGCIVPVLYHVVGAVMNLNFDCVPTIVDEEYYVPLSTANHC